VNTTQASDCLAELAAIAYDIRRLSLEMITYSRWGHPGGSLSLADILAVLYFHAMVVDPTRPRVENRDRLVLSKAHAAPALYAALALRGFFPVEEVYTYCELGGRLEGHVHAARTPGIEASGGPLGIGLSVAAGMALGLRAKELPRPRVYCVLGDGEANEGNVWEAAMAAAQYRLDNLIAVVDYNKLMAKGPTHALMGVEPFADKWRAFGWDVLEVDGHDLAALLQAFHEARWVRPHGAPITVLAHTVKGRGVEMAEFNYKWHTHAPDPETADVMLRQLARAYGRPEAGYSRLGMPHAKETFYGGE
jgi:transketolase